MAGESKVQNPESAAEREGAEERKSKVGKTAKVQCPVAGNWELTTDA
jgi:hypothetical protein